MPAAWAWRRCATSASRPSGVTFCLSEARLGLLPATIGPYVVRAMGESASRRYFTTAERFGAAEAHRIGLVHEVAEPEALDATVDALVAALVANGPQAVRACKRLVQDVAGRPDRRGAARRHRAAHRRHPRQRRGQGRRAVLPRQASAGLAAAAGQAMRQPVSTPVLRAERRAAPKPARIPSPRHRGSARTRRTRGCHEPRTLRHLPRRRLRRHRRAGAGQPEHAGHRHGARPARGGGLCRRRRRRLHDAHAVGGARRLGAGGGVRGAVQPRQAGRRGLPAVAGRAGPARARRPGPAVGRPGRRHARPRPRAAGAASCRAC